MNVHPLVDFEDRQVVVTGASSGIGRAIAVELGRCGAVVTLIGRDSKRLAETAGMIEKGRSRTLALDLQNTEAIHDTVKEFAASHGRIYGLCHSAGIVETRPLHAARPEGLQKLMNVHVAAAMELSRALCRRDVMTDDGASILFISSIYAWVGTPGQIAYSASKGAMLSAARAMAVELARRKIRVNTLSPGLVRTPMTERALALLSEAQVRELENTHPLGPGKPEDVARAAAFLLAPQNSWITGTDMIIDGGYTAT